MSFNSLENTINIKKTNSLLLLSGKLVRRRALEFIVHLVELLIGFRIGVDVGSALDTGSTFATVVGAAAVVLVVVVGIRLAKVGVALEAGVSVRVVGSVATGARSVDALLLLLLVTRLLLLIVIIIVVIVIVVTLLLLLRIRSRRHDVTGRSCRRTTILRKRRGRDSHVAIVVIGTRLRNHAIVVVVTTAIVVVEVTTTATTLLLLLAVGSRFVDLEIVSAGKSKDGRVGAGSSSIVVVLVSGRSRNDSGIRRS